MIVVGAMSRKSTPANSWRVIDCGVLVKRTLPFVVLLLQLAALVVEFRCDRMLIPFAPTVVAERPPPVPGLPLVVVVP